MKLADWMTENEVSAAEMSRRIGLPHEGTLYRYLRGDRIPRRPLMAAIVRETGGAVRPDDFFDVPGAAEASTPPPVVSPDPEPRADPAALAAILDQLGGHAVVAEGSGVPVTDLEAMQAQGLIWGQYRPALIAFAREFGGAELDPAQLTLRSLGKDSPSWRAAS